MWRRPSAWGGRGADDPSPHPGATRRPPHESLRPEGRKRYPGGEGNPTEGFGQPGGRTPRG
jgi:hypothetical protein